MNALKRQLPTFGKKTRSLDDIISTLETDINELVERSNLDKETSIEIGKQIDELKKQQDSKVKDSERGMRIADRFKELLK